MQVLFIILIVLAVLALILLSVTIPQITVIVHFKNNVLSLHIRHWIYKKKFEINMGSKGYEITEETEPEAAGPDKEKKVSFKDRLIDAKNRIFNSEKGFDTEELENVKNEFCELYSDIMGILKTFFKRFRYRADIPLLRIKLDYGTDNPATTGMIYGWIWGAIGTLYPVATRYFHIAYPQVDLTPDFYGRRYDLEIKSIIKVRGTHIINAAVPALWSPLITYLKNKNKKGRGKNGR